MHPLSHATYPVSKATSFTRKWGRWTEALGRTLVWTRTDEEVEVVQADQLAPNKVYILVNFMKVPEGGEERYREVERTWKKLPRSPAKTPD